jgi:hypothetical protein
MHLASTVRLSSLRDRVGYLLAPGENERVTLLEVGGLVSPRRCCVDEPAERAAAVRLVAAQLRLLAVSSPAWGERIARSGNPAVVHQVIISPPPQAERLEGADYLWLAQSAAMVQRWGRADEGGDRAAWVVVLHEKPGLHGRPGHVHMLDLLLDGRGRVRDVRRDWIHNEAATTVAALQFGLPIVPGRHPRGVLALLDAHDPGAVPAYEDALRAALHRTAGAALATVPGREALLAAYARHVVPTLQRHQGRRPVGPEPHQTEAPAPAAPRAGRDGAPGAGAAAGAARSDVISGEELASLGVSLARLRSAVEEVASAARVHAVAVGPLRGKVLRHAVEPVGGVGVWRGVRGLHVAAAFAAPAHAQCIGSEPEVAESHARLEVAIGHLAMAARGVRAAAAREGGADLDSLAELGRLRAAIWEGLAWVPPGAVGEELPAARCAALLDPRGVPVAARHVHAATAAAQGHAEIEFEAAPWEVLYASSAERGGGDVSTKEVAVAGQVRRAHERGER